MLLPDYNLLRTVLTWIPLKWTSFSQLQEEGWRTEQVGLFIINYKFARNTPEQANEIILWACASIYCLSFRETVRLNWKPRASRQNPETWEVCFNNCFARHPTLAPAPGLISGHNHELKTVVQLECTFHVSLSSTPVCIQWLSQYVRTLLRPLFVFNDFLSTLEP